MQCSPSRVHEGTLRSREARINFPHDFACISFRFVVSPLGESARTAIVHAVKTCPLCKLPYPDARSFCFIDGADLVPLTDTRIGTILAGRYRIECVLGEGGMATVYGAKHLLVDRDCAIKILNPVFAREETVRKRFYREARNTQKLAHPNVIDIFDQGETEEDRTPFIVMEKLKGITLAELIAKGPVEIDRAVHLMIQMSTGIARAHDLDVVHRDLKPENIFIATRADNGGDIIKILDFGIARALKEERLTNAGEVFGTPQYMAPERISQPDAGASSDVYSLGVVFFEMLTGQLPFEAKDIATFFIKHLKEAPRDPRTIRAEIPEPLAELVVRMLAKTPEGRPVDAHKIRTELTTLAVAYGFKVPVEPSKDVAASSRKAATTLSPLAESRWTRSINLLQKLVFTAHGDVPPEDVLRTLGGIRERVPEVVRLRRDSITAQAELEAIQERGRELRLQFGFAVDQLGNDFSNAKNLEREANTAFVEQRNKSEVYANDFIQLHKEILLWEGRTGFQNPTRDLSETYRRAASLTEEWAVQKEIEHSARALLDQAAQAARDIEYQIHELRTALATHERKVEEDEHRSLAKVTEAGRKADQIEKALREDAKRISDPFGSRQEFAQMVAEIQASGAP